MNKIITLFFCGILSAGTAFSNPEKLNEMVEAFNTVLERKFRFLRLDLSRSQEKRSIAYKEKENPDNSFFYKKFDEFFGFCEQKFDEFFDNKFEYNDLTKQASENFLSSIRTQLIPLKDSINFFIEKKIKRLNIIKKLLLVKKLMTYKTR